MTKRFKRLRDFDVSLQIKNAAFIHPPRDAQKNWLLNRALNEFVDDLAQLDEISRDLVPGADAQPLEDRTQAKLADEEIMESWQRPLMNAMAEAVTASHGDVLEVGFGLGVSSAYIQAQGVNSHTIIECNDSIVERFHAWRNGYPDADIRLIHGRWQDVIGQLDVYDGVFFHTYPLNESERLEHVADSTTFAEHFMPTAAAHTRVGGAFTYLTNEIDSLSRGHQRLLFKYFDSIELRVIDSLNLPHDVKDAWWANSMVVVRAVK